jgi:hypothetical protein
MGAVKYCREHTFKFYSDRDPCDILSAPSNSVPTQKTGIVRNNHMNKGMWTRAGAMFADDYIIRIIGWKWFRRDL